MFQGSWGEVEETGSRGLTRRAAGRKALPVGFADETLRGYWKSPEH